MRRLSHFAVAMGLLCAAASASAQIRITEYMYNGAGSGPDQNREFVELTNIGTSAIDMTGWSFDDSSQTPGSLSLSVFGSVSPGESVIISEQSATVFRSDWGLPAAIKVIGGNTQNLGRADEINIYNNLNALIDRLTYDDQTIGGSIRTNGTSGWPAPSALGLNNILGWQKSVLGDQQNSYLSANLPPSPQNLANPGFYVPEPATLLLLLVAAAARRRRCI